MTTDVQLPATDDQQEGPQAPDAVTYPQFPDNPNNHLYTISMDGRGPMIVVRGNTPEEINERYQALMDAGTTAVAAAVFSHMKAEMNVAQGLGPVTAIPAPQAPPAVPQGPMTPPPFGPNVSVPAAPGYAGPPAPPAQWAPPPVAAVQPPSDEYRQAGWYKLTVPYPKKTEFDGICSQYSLRKGRPSEPGGQYSFQKADKSWYVAADVAGAFPQFSPVPA